MNNASYLSTFNSTYAASTANNSWNETYANLLYANISWNYNQTYSGSTFNLTYAGLMNNASYLSTYNLTYASNNAHTHDAANITEGAFGAGEYNMSGNLTFNLNNQGLALGNARIYWNGTSLVIKVT